MTFRAAAKLHNRDEIRLKETGEVGYVLEAYRSLVDPKVIEIQAVFPQSGFQKVIHLEIS